MEVHCAVYQPLSHCVNIWQRHWVCIISIFKPPLLWVRVADCFVFLLNINTIASRIFHSCLISFFYKLHFIRWHTELWLNHKIFVFVKLRWIDALWLYKCCPHIHINLSYYIQTKLVHHRRHLFLSEFLITFPVFSVLLIFSPRVPWGAKISSWNQL